MLRELPLQNLTGLPAAEVLPLLAQACGNISPERLQQLWENYAHTPGQKLLGWTQAGKPVALAGLGLTGEAAVLQHLAVAPQARGQGWGSALLTALGQELDLYGLEAETDAEAVAFYRRCGWAVLELGPNRWGRPRYGAWWLHSERVLTPGFRFPTPPIQALHLPSAPEADVRMLRLDKIHPLLGGNKWFKLRHQLIQAREQGIRRLVTLGGAWSNHLFACAAACRLLGFTGTALVRGELGNAQGELNPRLAFARACGLELVSVERSEYRRLRTPEGVERLSQSYPDALILPEGGKSRAALQGLAELMDWIPDDTRTLACACGTATTLAGLIAAAPADLKLLGVSVLKGDFLASDVRELLMPTETRAAWEIETRFHAGGYARNSPELLAFIASFQALNPGIPIEPIYTGKLLWALNQRLAEGTLARPLIVIHCGGLLPGELS